MSLPTARRGAARYARTVALPAEVDQAASQVPTGALQISVS
ncbi:MAG TPA: hypothetical protein VF308_01505 [Caldimonas sp.]